MEARGLAGGVVFGLLLFFTSFFGSIFLLAPLLPITFIHPKWCRRLMDTMIFLWKLYAVALYENLYHVKVVITGHPIPSHQDGSALIVMNHRTRMDWMFLFSYQVRYGSLSRYIISLKEILKQVPGGGWAMQCSSFIFLNRRWEKDRAAIDRGLDYFSRLNFRPQILLFPEGTDLTPDTCARSKIFAEKNQLPVYQYVLHPRTTGFVHFVQRMKEAKMLDSVLDITIAYPKSCAQNEGDILIGKFPEEIHFDVKQYMPSELPCESQDLRDWCCARWSDKDKWLQDYYQKQHFYDADQGNNNDNVNENITQILFYFAMIFWTLFEVFVVYILVLSPVVRWYCVTCSILFVVLGKKWGIECLLAESVKISSDIFK
ncbi:hypothetical protein ScPMuIL_014189 [Solemya velum]